MSSSSHPKKQPKKMQNKPQQVQALPEEWPSRLAWDVDGKTRFCDIGANLLATQFQGKYHGRKKHEADLDRVIDRAVTLGVSPILVTCGQLGEARKTRDFITNWEKQRVEAKQTMFYTVGVHPTRAGEFDKHPEGPDAYLNELLKLAREGKASGKCVAIGECGLDYDRLQFADKKTQLAHFKKHFVLTEETGLPMFLHSRATGSEFYEYVRTHRDQFSSGVVHSFTGSVDEMREAVDMQLYIGINGCSLRTEESLAVAREIPADRLLIETDAPWCGIKRTHPSYPHIQTHFPRDKHESKYNPEADAGGVKGRCEPSHIVQVVEVLAAVREEDPVELAATVYKNSMDLFFPNGI